MGRIDADLCAACELRTSEVPEVFQIGGDMAEPIQPDVPATFAEEVKQAAEECPVAAIKVD